MFTLVIALHIIVSIFLVTTILFQSGKGASVGASLGGGTSSQALFGSSGPAGFLTKVTAACAVVFMLTSLYLTYISTAGPVKSIMKSVPTVKEIPVETQAPAETKKAAPTPATTEGGEKAK